MSSLLAAGQALILVGQCSMSGPCDLFSVIGSTSTRYAEMGKDNKITVCRQVDRQVFGNPVLCVHYLNQIRQTVVSGQSLMQNMYTSQRKRGLLHAL